MTTINLRRLLLAAALFVPAVAAAVFLWLHYWTLAATATIILMSVVGAVSALNLGELRAVKRQSARESKKIVQLSKALAALDANQQRLRRETKEVSAGASVNHASIGQLEKTTAATLARAEQAERRIVGILESLRLANDDSTAGARSIAAAREVRSELETLRQEVTKQASRTTSSTVTRLTAVARDETRQVEALLQLLPTIAPVAPLPPSGKWAMDARTLLHLSHLCRTTRPINVLEIGGGTSTVWLAYLLRGAEASITSVDHDPAYAQLTQESLERHGITAEVTLRTAPLEPIELAAETFNWYRRDAFNDLFDIDFLVIDGPPEGSGSLARYPALPVLHDRLARRCTILLDDADRPDEIRATERWLEEFAGFVRVDEGVSRLAVLVRNN